MLHRLAIAALAVALAPLPTTAQASADYVLAQDVATSQGELQILEDGRITRSMENRMWGHCADPTFIFDGKPEAKLFERTPPRPARLRQVDASGTIIADLVPDENAPVARIQAERLGPADRPVLLVEADDGACWGSYSGLVRLFFQFEGGRIAPVMLADETGKSAQVMMVSTVKSQARFAKKSAAEIIIHQVSSHPDFERAKTLPKGASMPFVIDYSTTRFDGAKWTRAMRSEPGVWEAGDGTPFPAADKFP